MVARAIELDSFRLEILDDKRKPKRPGPRVPSRTPQGAGIEGAAEQSGRARPLAARRTRELCVPGGIAAVLVLERPQARAAGGRDEVTTICAPPPAA